MIDYCKINNIEIDCVEIAGDLMRTPILQKMIEDKKLKISKTILIDECTSIGASLLGNFFNGNFPIEDLKKVYKVREINQNNEKISMEDIIFKEEIIYHIQTQQIMDLKFDYFILLKIELSKLINKIKGKNKNNELNEINKKLRNMDIHENYLDKIYNDFQKYLEKEKIKKQFNELIEEYENSINNIKSNNENLIKEIEFKFKKKHLLINIEKKFFDFYNNLNTKGIELLNQIINFLDENIKEEAQIEIMNNKLESLNNIYENNKDNFHEIIMKTLKEYINI